MKIRNNVRRSCRPMIQVGMPPPHTAAFCCYREEAWLPYWLYRFTWQHKCYASSRAVIIGKKSSINNASLFSIWKCTETHLYAAMHIHACMQAHCVLSVYNQLSLSDFQQGKWIWEDKSFIRYNRRAHNLPMFQDNMGHTWESNKGLIWEHMLCICSSCGHPI